jgi:hypothetical protein
MLRAQHFHQQTGFAPGAGVQDEGGFGGQAHVKPGIGNRESLLLVIPAQAGIQRLSFKSPRTARRAKSLDPGLTSHSAVESRRDDEMKIVSN